MGSEANAKLDPATKKIITKLENDLSQYLIQEVIKEDPSKRDTHEAYKYKGLTIEAETKSKNFVKTIKIRVGIMEVEFKLGTLERVSGSLTDKEEKLIKLWMEKRENERYLRNLFSEDRGIKSVSIIPFDLEDYYRDN